MNDLTTFQRDILYVIVSMNDPYGLAIKRGLQDYYGKEVNHGRLYPNLDTLVDKGLIQKDAKDRRTNEYTLTERGRREIASRREWENKLIQNGNEKVGGDGDSDTEEDRKKSARQASPTSALLDDMENEKKNADGDGAESSGGLF